MPKMLDPYFTNLNWKTQDLKMYFHDKTERTGSQRMMRLTKEDNIEKTLYNIITMNIKALDITSD